MNPTLILLGLGLLLWWLHQRGQRRDRKDGQLKAYNDAIRPEATNGLPQQPELVPSRPATIQEMGDQVARKLMERTL